MKQKNLSLCAPVTLKPIKTSVPHIPPCPDSTESDLAFTLDENNDPEGYRCQLASFFDDDLTSGKWKHYLTVIGFEQATYNYEQMLLNKKWYRRLDFSNNKLSAVLYGKEQKAFARNLIVFATPNGYGTRFLVGHKAETQSKT